MLNLLGSQISVDGIIKILPEISRHLSLTNTRKVINKGIIAPNKAVQRKTRGYVY